MDLGTKCYSLVFALFAGACGAVVQNDDGDDPDLQVAPPALGLEPAGDGTAPPQDGPLAIAAVPTQIADERGDLVTFEDGVPHHVHAGETITIGAPQSCVEVFKYGYLLGAQAPAIGSEEERNPIAFRFRTTSAATADYRVRLDNDTLVEWTPVQIDDEGDLEVAVTRDRVARLATTAGRYFVDVRARSADGAEVGTSSCWEHRPLAAPVDVTGFREATRAGSLSTFSLPADSPISHFIQPGAGVPVLESSITHATNEPVTIRIAAPAEPGAIYTTRVANDIVAVTASANVFCGTTCTGGFGCTPVPSNDARCNTTVFGSAVFDPADAPRSGTLESLDWKLRVLDLGTGQIASACTVIGLTATCELAARSQNDPQRLVAQLIASGARELGPTGTVGEHSFLGLGYTGLPLQTAAVRCEQEAISVSGFERTTRCTQVTTFFRMHAIDQASVVFTPPALLVETGAGASALATPPYLPDGAAGISMTWDAGNDDLPGAN